MITHQSIVVAETSVILGVFEGVGQEARRPRPKWCHDPVCAHFWCTTIGGRIGVSGRSSGRLIGGNYPPSSPIRSCSGLTGSPQLRPLPLAWASTTNSYIPPKEHHAVPAKIAGDDVRQLSLSRRSVSRLPLLVNLLSVLCPLKHPPYPPTWPGRGTFVVPLSSTTRTSLEYCNLQHDSYPAIPQYEIVKSRSGGRRALAFLNRALAAVSGANRYFAPSLGPCA